jgi:hypothetical protein
MRCCLRTKLLEIVPTHQTLWKCTHALHSLHRLPVLERISNQFSNFSLSYSQLSTRAADGIHIPTRGLLKKRISNRLPFCVLVCFQKKSCRSWCAFCQAPRWPKSNGNYSRWWEYTASLEKAHWPDGCNERATGCYITPCSCFHLAIPSMPLSLSMLIK